MRRTQDALRKALIELIVEKGFEATNISEIAARANVGRSTFYAHYADKEDLLQGSVEGLREFLQGAVDARRRDGSHDGHPALAFCLPMLEHAEEGREIFAAMVGRRGGYLFQELLHDVLADFLRASWTGADELEVQAIIGAFGSVLHWWSTTAPGLTAREVEARFVALTTPALG